MILPADERFALVTLRDMITHLQAHIDHRAAEIAAPRIDEAREAEDLVTELRRQVTDLHHQYAALERRRAEQQQRAEQAEADLTAAHENRGAEIHGEPRTDRISTQDTRPAP